MIEYYYSHNGKWIASTKPTLKIAIKPELGCIIGRNLPPSNPSFETITLLPKYALDTLRQHIQWLDDSDFDNRFVGIAPSSCA